MTAVNKRALFLYLSFALFLLLRLVYAVAFGAGVVPSDDSFAYNLYAVKILESPHWYLSNDFGAHGREPGYPLFLALIYLVFGKENFIAVHITQAFISLGTVVMIARLAYRFFDRKAAYIALFWSGLHVFYIYYCGTLIRETLIVFLITGMFYLLSGIRSGFL